MFCFHLSGSIGQWVLVFLFLDFFPFPPLQGEFKSGFKH